MGNFMSCSSSSSQSKQVKKKPFSKRFSSYKDNNTNNRSSSNRWSKKEKFEDDSLLNQQEAIAAAALLFQQQQNVGGGAAFDRSTSLRYTNNTLKKQTLPRSSSSRARSISDTILQPHQLLNQELKMDELETSHFVLVHGGGYGAWCWYKTITLLEEAGFKVDAIDLTGSGIHSCDTNTITTLDQYVDPLIHLLQNLPGAHKVILVGHDFGGVCISYAMELFPHKIAKAIFIAASMLADGQSTLGMFNQQSGSNDLMRQAQVFVYAKGKDHPPTAIDIDKSLLRDLLFNQSPAKDVALASVSMRPIPFAPVLEKLSLSEGTYGAVRRFYIQTTEDDAIPLSIQQNMINSNPPERVFRIKGSDHSPFFSKPQSLHKHLVEISSIPAIEKCGDSITG